MSTERLPADALMIKLSSPHVHAIRQLCELGYGDGYGTPASVVLFALDRFIDDLKRAGIIKPYPGQTAA